MANCVNKIVKNITSNCSTTTVAGLETTAYVINREDIATQTVSTGSTVLITDITLVSGTTAYSLTGIKKNMNAGFERVISEDMPDMFKHKVTFKGFEFDSESVENIDNMGDLVVIVERKDKQNPDGTFVIYGLGTGLYVSADTYTANDNNGTRVIEMGTQDGQLERVSQNNFLKTDYATTKAYLESLL